MVVKEKSYELYIYKKWRKKVEHFIQSCIEKRKKIINEGIDTGNLVDNAAKLSINDVLLSINYFHASNLRKHTYSVLITDHFRGELTLIYEADFIKCEKQSIILNDETKLPDEEAIVSDIALFIDKDGEYLNSWGITDYANSNPLCLKENIDFVKNE